MIFRAALLLISGLMVISAVAAEPEPVSPNPPYLFVLGVAQDAGYPQAGCYQPIACEVGKI